MHPWRQGAPRDRANTGETLRERHVSMVRVLLRAFLLVLLLIIGLSFVLLGPGSLSWQGLASLLGIGLLVVWALARLRRGRLGQAVGLVITGVLALLAVETAETGIRENQNLLFAYTVPIAFAGLLLGRWALAGTAFASVAIVLAVHLLETAGVDWVAFDPASDEPIRTVIVFTLIIALLTLVLERFGVELMEAHDAALRRQSELEREIEWRKEAELERDRSEARFKLASEAVGVGSWSWDLETGEITWSDSLRELLEVPADQPATLEAFLAKVHPEDRPMLQQVSSDPPESSDQLEMTYRIVRAGERVIWVAARYRTLPEADGRGRQMVGVVYEITERKQAERERERLLERERIAREAAETSGARLAFLAEASHLLVSSLDFGETLRRLTDLMVPRWADWCAVDVVDGDERPQRLAVAHQDPDKVRWARAIQERYLPRPGSPTSSTAIKEGRTRYLPEISDADLVAFARDEEHLRLLRSVGFASMVVVPLKTRDRSFGALTLVTAESGRRYSKDDVLFFEELAGRAAVAVEHSRLFNEIRSLNQELEHRVELRTRELKDALSELETFAYSVSHDLRAPLRGIDGFSQALLEDYGESLQEDAVQYLRRIRAGARRMGELIDDLLNLSRLSQGSLNHEEVDLTQLAGEIVADLRGKDPARDVEVEIATGLKAHGDRRLLRVALENIIGNAWKFTGTSERPRIEVGATMQAGETVYYVRDNGTGFDMNYSDKLFAPFQRLHSAKQFEGTGIGLATVQRVLRRHGGRIWAEGKIGEGATFYFTISP
jgi:PAS domain S-box-containing protein